MLLANIREEGLFFDVVVANREQAARALERTGELRGGKSFTPEREEHHKKASCRIKSHV